MESSIFIQGFLFMGSLVAAFGPQNLHVLRAGISRAKIELVILVCCFGELLFISAGVLGLGAFRNEFPQLMGVLKLLGFALLLYYAEQASRRSHSVDLNLNVPLAKPVQTAFLMTFCNPCVFLDTVFLVGTQAGAYHASARWSFAAGALLASWSWYFFLGFGSQQLSHVLQRPKALRSIDRFSALILYCSAWQLSQASL